MSFGSLTRSNPRTFQTNFPKTCDPPFFREWVRQVKKKQQKIIVPGTVGWYGIDLFNKPRDPDLNWTFFSWWPSLKLTAAKKNTWNARVGRWGFLIKGLFSDAMLLFVLGSVFWFFLLKCLNPNHLHVWFFSSSQHGFNTICRTKNEPWPCSRCFFTKQTSLSFRKAKSSKTHIDTHPSYMMLTWYVVWIAFIFSIPSYPILSTCEEITFLQQKKTISSMGCQGYIYPHEWLTHRIHACQVLIFHGFSCIRKIFPLFP